MSVRSRMFAENITKNFGKYNFVDGLTSEEILSEFDSLIESISNFYSHLMNNGLITVEARSYAFETKRNLINTITAAGNYNNK